MQKIKVTDFEAEGRKYRVFSGEDGRFHVYLANHSGLYTYPVFEGTFIELAMWIVKIADKKYNNYITGGSTV